MDCVPGCGILSDLSTDSNPWFSRLPNGLPQLTERMKDEVKSWRPTHTSDNHHLFDHKVLCFQPAEGSKYLPQREGGRQCGVVELGALWLCVRTLWWLLAATELAVCSDWSPAVSGSCTKQVFVVGLETGVPWTGGEGQGEPRGDTLEGGNPAREHKEFKTEHKTDPISYSYFLTCSFVIVCLFFCFIWISVTTKHIFKYDNYIVGPSEE